MEINIKLASKHQEHSNDKV